MGKFLSPHIPFTLTEPLFVLLYFPFFIHNLLYTVFNTYHSFTQQNLLNEHVPVSVAGAHPHLPPERLSISFLEKKNLKLREVKQLAQDHRATKWQSWTEPRSSSREGCYSPLLSPPPK